METPRSQRNIVQHKKQTRNPEIDIVGGASQTDQLDGLHKNASKSPAKKSSKDELLTPDNGSIAPNNDDQKDLENPALRGI
ncbi:MAG: hypothetical protein EOO91_00990 [Pedobacter sp.]|nr:MAG: hypothetical protein EOO91_00990 [Pedobacter sp.]